MWPTTQRNRRPKPSRPMVLSRVFAISAFATPAASVFWAGGNLPWVDFGYDVGAGSFDSAAVGAANRREQRLVGVVRRVQVRRQPVGLQQARHSHLVGRAASPPWPIPLVPISQARARASHKPLRIATVRLA